MNIEIANKLVKLRKEHNLSQEELANKLGISRQAVSKWERAEASPDTDNLIKLASLYKISLDELLLSDEEIVQEVINDKNIEDEIDPKDTINDFIDNIKKIAKDAQEGKSKYKVIYYPGRTINLAITIFFLIGFFLFGFITGKWQYAWLLLLCIPVTSSLVFAIKVKKMRYFNYPFFVALIYFALGFFLNWWVYAWIIFLTIPLFYSITARKKKIIHL
ncbi:MAG TPA: helix-turn-helix transcriptional regulator [Acholeplasmataceae bacterium]|nr:helix-turn-helix transcriptional regulator [Acholeplasmataceae bacterium]